MTDTTTTEDAAAASCAFLGQTTRRADSSAEQVAARNVLRLVSGKGPDTWPKWPCPDCGEEMAHPQGVPVDVVDQICEPCMKVRRVAQQRKPARLFGSREQELARIGVPPMFRREFIEPQEWPRVHGGPDMRTWAGAPFFVTLAGVVGSGKTMLATELLWRRLPHVQTASWWRAGTAISTVFGSFGEERARAAMCDLYDSELLVLDEIGRGHDGRAWGAIVEIISHRHEQHRETIFTTNRKIGTRQTGQDKERGLAEEDPALFRRLAEGAIVGLMKPWGGR